MTRKPLYIKKLGTRDRRRKAGEIGSQQIQGRRLFCYRTSEAEERGWSVNIRSSVGLQIRTLCIWCDCFKGLTLLDLSKYHALSAKTFWWISFGTSVFTVTNDEVMTLEEQHRPEALLLLIATHNLPCSKSSPTALTLQSLHCFAYTQDGSSLLRCYGSCEYSADQTQFRGGHSRLHRSLVQEIARPRVRPPQSLHGIPRVPSLRACCDGRLSCLHCSQ